MYLNKAVIAYDQEELDPKIKEIPAEFHEMYEIIKTRSMLLEFMPKGVTKAYGISLLAKERIGSSVNHFLHHRLP